MSQINRDRATLQDAFDQALAKAVNRCIAESANQEVALYGGMPGEGLSDMTIAASKPKDDAAIVTLLDSDEPEDAPDQMTVALQTWPERIWLMHSTEDDYPVPKYREDTDEISWCDERQCDNDVEYVRADLSTRGLMIAALQNAYGLVMMSHEDFDDVQKHIEKALDAAGVPYQAGDVA